MPTKIRLQRHGKKKKPFYHIVIADGRAPRDGKFIEKIGTYNPITKPATINLQFDRAIHWLQVGALPTDTVKAILSFKGVLYKNHLLKGVTKGALTLEQAEAKFITWTKEKEAKIENVILSDKNQKIEHKRDMLSKEKEKNELRLAELSKRRKDEEDAKAAKIAEERKAAEDAARAEEEETAAPAEETVAPAEEATTEVADATTEEAPATEE